MVKISIALAVLAFTAVSSPANAGIFGKPKEDDEAIYDSTDEGEPTTRAPGPHLIYSESVTNWGEWATNVDTCPEGSFVEGFDIKFEGVQGLGDDTSMNGLRLYCGDPNNPDAPKVTSSVGDFGDWGKKFFCTSSTVKYATGFQLRVEPPGHADETATNNIRIFCQGRVDPIEADGGNVYGEWGDIQMCEPDEAVCGIQTQVQPDQGNLGDDTALNNIALLCCPL